MSVILIIIIVALGIKVLKQQQQETSRGNANKNRSDMFSDEELEKDLAEVQSVIDDADYIKKAYQPKWLFSQHEKAAYFAINEIAQKHGFIVFAKVRLLDLITPIRNHPKYKTNFYRIQAKHVDFVLTGRNLVAKYVIELDDSSHDRPDRKRRDIFVDNVLTACGYKVLHTRYITEEEILKLIS